MSKPCPTCLPIPVCLPEEVFPFSVMGKQFNGHGTTPCCSPSLPLLGCPSDPVFPFSLTTQPRLPFVANCPAGFDCANSNTISFRCGTNVITVARPPNATVQQLSDIFALIIAECAALNTPVVNPPSTFFLSATVSSPATCPDGSTNTVTLPAGQYAGTSFSDAQSHAQSNADSQALAQQLCLGTVSSSVVVGNPYTSFLVSTGAQSSGLNSGSWSISAGSLPPGLTLGPSAAPYSSVSISGTPTAPGTYSFTVQAVSSAGIIKTKSFTISVSPTGPSLTLTPGPDSISASWSAVAIATSYQLFRQVHGGGPFVLVNTTSGNSFNDTSVSEGVSYDYQVSAFDGAVLLGSSTIQTASPIPIPNITLTPAIGGMSVTWSAVSGASVYDVLRAPHGAGTFTTLIASTTATSFSDVTCIGGTSYDYEFKAYQSIGGTLIVTSHIATATPLIPAASVLSGTAGDGQVSLSWTAVTGAGSYALYRSTVNGGPYAIVTTVAALNFTDTGLTDGTTYYYVVKSLANATVGPNSNQVTATPVAVPALHFKNLAWYNPPQNPPSVVPPFGVSPPHGITITNINLQNDIEVTFSGTHPDGSGGYILNLGQFTYTGPATTCSIQFNINNWPTTRLAGDYAYLAVQVYDPATHTGFFDGGIYGPSKITPTPTYGSFPLTFLAAPGTTSFSFNIPASVGRTIAVYYEMHSVFDNGTWNFTAKALLTPA